MTSRAFTQVMSPRASMMRLVSFSSDVIGKFYTDVVTGLPLFLSHRGAARRTCDYTCGGRARLKESEVSERHYCCPVLLSCTMSAFY